MSRVGASHINLPRLKKKKEEKMKKTTEEGAKNTDMVWIYKTEWCTGNPEVTSRTFDYSYWLY